MKKTTNKATAKRAPAFRTRLIALAVSSCFSGAVYAAGVNPNVVAGSATISQSGNVTTVTNSNGTIINWGALSVLPGEKLIFDQAATSSVLNRVIGMNVNGKWVLDPTVIAGTISSKGGVWIINTSGLLVKQGAVIDVARFVGSTIDVSNANFLAGKLLFDGTPGTGAVVIERGASITTGTGGSVYLIGSNVTNNGIITTPEGETILAAGQSVSIADTGTPGVKVEITGSGGNATNLGTILAEAGRVGIAGALVRNSGTLNASSVVKEGGRIFLKASQDAYVDGSGRIVTTGTKGGTVEVLGNRVAVMDNASIDASGNNGGGTVLIGGDYQGKNAAIQNSTVTYLGQNASIKADATDKGNGGKVILWSDGTTRSYGALSARGGSKGGNGGFVETSGKQFLDVTRAANVGAVNGLGGTWLLDPTDLTIVHGVSDTGTTGSSPFEPLAAGGSQLSDTTINAGLSSGNVLIQTSYGGDIKFDGTSGSGGPVVITSAVSGRTLSVQTGGDIKFAGTTTFQTSGTGTLGITFNPNAKVEVASGAILNFAGSGGALVASIAGIGGKTWDNYGTVNLSGNSAIDLENAGYVSTFSNKSGGVVNITSSAGWSFFSENTNDSGVIDNAGVINVNGTSGGNYDAWEAKYNQQSGGVLNIGAGKQLSMQNADTIYGAVNIGSNGRLKISESHGGARTFYGTITGPGALDIGGQSVTFSGVTLNGATLANSSGNLTVPTGITNYVGNVGFYASGNVTFASGSSTSFTGGLTVRAGWNGGGFGSATASSVTAGTGDILVDGASVQSAGAMDWQAGRNITIQGNSANSAYVHAGGSQTLKADSTSGTVSVTGYTDGTNRGARVESLSGTQTVSAHTVSVYGGGTGSGVYSGNQASITANGNQNIEAAMLFVEGGGNAAYGGYGNYALIKQNSAGYTQTISSPTGPGYMYVSGGAGGYDNRGEIDGGMGSQTIGDSTRRFQITLWGGASGGMFDQGNDAGIHLSDVSSGTQTVYGTSVSIYGGNATYGGAGFGAPRQRFDLSGDLLMQGGSSTAIDTDGIPGGAAYIGSKYGGDIQITSTGNIDLIGGSGSPVLIGSLSGTALVDITAAGNVTVSSDAGGAHGGVYLGSMGNLSPDFLSNDVLMGSSTSITSGGNATLYSYGGAVALGYVKATGTATVTAHDMIVDQNGAALNVEASNVALHSLNGGDASYLAISADTKATATITATVDNTATYGGISIRNRGTQPTGLVTLTDNASYNGNISFYNKEAFSMGSSTFTATTHSGDLMVATGGNLTTDTGTYQVRNGGSMKLVAGGNVDVVGSTYAKDAASNLYYQDIGIVAGGDITISNGSYVAGRDIALGAGGALNVYGSATTSDGAMRVKAGDVNVNGGLLKSRNDTEILAGNVTVDSGGRIEAGFTSPNSMANISIAVTGNIRVNNGSSIVAGNDIYLDMLGATSAVYVNDGLTANQSTSYIWADAYGVPMTTYLNFGGRSSGGVVINGVETTTTAAGGSGFWNGYPILPGVAGSTLKITYGVTENPVVNVITQALNNATTNNNLSDNTASNNTTTLILKPVTVATTQTQTAGGDSEDSFGGTEKKDDTKKDTNNSDTKEKNNGKSTAKNQCS